jgi:hypothetical protein
MLIIGTLREAGWKGHYPACPVTANMSFDSCLVAPYVVVTAIVSVSLLRCSQASAVGGQPSAGPGMFHTRGTLPATIERLPASHEAMVLCA